MLLHQKEIPNDNDATPIYNRTTADGHQFKYKKNLCLNNLKFVLNAAVSYKALQVSLQLRKPCAVAIRLSCVHASQSGWSEGPSVLSFDQWSQQVLTSWGCNRREFRPEPFGCSRCGQGWLARRLAAQCCAGGLWEEHMQRQTNWKKGNIKKSGSRRKWKTHLTSLEASQQWSFLWKPTLDVRALHLTALDSQCAPLLLSNQLCSRPAEVLCWAGCPIKETWKNDNNY